MKFPFEVITDPNNIGTVLEGLQNQPFIALDLETTGFDHNRDLIHGISLANDKMAWYVTLGAEKAIIPPLLELTKTLPVVGHNIKFDYHFLMKYGAPPPVSYDTMLGQALLDENQDLGLKSLAQVHLGIREELPGFNDLLREYKPILGRRILGDMNIYDLPINEVAEYAARDSRLTYDLWLKTSYGLANEGFMDMFLNTDMPFMYMLLDMEHRGFFLDLPLLYQLETRYTKYQQEALENFNKITGGINPNSPKQLSKFFYETLGFEPTRFSKQTNQPSVDSLALLRMSKDDTSGAVKALQEFRYYDKLLNTYVIPFINMQFGGRLSGKFNQNGAVTGRLSSSEPNLQNIPSGADKDGVFIRTLFAAPPDHSLVDCDYSQLELRILAHYTKDEKLMEVFNTGGDPHQMTADLVGCVRSDAKTVNFARIYGSGPNTLADTIEESTGERPSIQTTRAWLKAYDEQYPMVPITVQRVIRRAQENGYIKTIGGRKRRVPDINSSDKMLRSRAERQVFNSLIQGSASDIMVKAMLDIHKIQHEYDANVLSQVHDELVSEVPDKSAREFGERKSQIMTASGEFFNMRVKLVAEPGIGKNWSESKH